MDVYLPHMPGERVDVAVHTVQELAEELAGAMGSAKHSVGERLLFLGMFEQVPARVAELGFGVIVVEAELIHGTLNVFGVSPQIVGLVVRVVSDGSSGFLEELGEFDLEPCASAILWSTESPEVSCLIDEILRVGFAGIGPGICPVHDLV